MGSAAYNERQSPKIGPSTSLPYPDGTLHYRRVKIALIPIRAGRRNSIAEPRIRLINRCIPRRRARRDGHRRGRMRHRPCLECPANRVAHSRVHARRSELKIRNRHLVIGRKSCRHTTEYQRGNKKKFFHRAKCEDRPAVQLLESNSSERYAFCLPPRSG